MSALFRASRTADFDGLYRQHAPSVYRYAYAVLGNSADAEDVTQQTFLNAYRAIAQGTKPRKPENWLLTIAHNEVRRHFRSTRGKALEVELDDQLPDRVPERDPSLADVLRALQHLPAVQRSALVMREFEGRSYAEIAESMNMTQSALEAQVFRARRALAEHLEGALTCTEAEEAVLRRLDSRLPRRIGRRLKAHLKECQACGRFADVQKRQSALLKGISVMPVPASLFLFRGEQAAAAGLGASAVAAGGSGAVGGGAAAAGAGGTGIAAGLVVKAAAVTAAVGVAGGVSYGVAASPDVVTKSERKGAHAAAVAETRRGGRAAEVRLARARGARPGPARPANARASRKLVKAQTPAARPPAHAEASVKAKGPPSVARAAAQAPPAVKVRPATPGATKRAAPKRPAPKTRARPAVGRKNEHSRPARTKPPRPAPAAAMQKQPQGAEPAAPPGAATRGPKR